MKCGKTGNSAPTAYLRGNRYWARWLDEAGHKVRMPLRGTDGRTLRSTAKRAVVLMALSEQYQQWMDNGATKQARQEVPWTLDKLLTTFMQINSAEWDEKTRKAYWAHVADMKTFFSSDRLITSITSLEAVSFQQWLRESKRITTGTTPKNGLSTISVNHRVSFARQVFQWAIDHDICPRNVFCRVKALRNQPVRNLQPFTTEEVRRLLHAAFRTVPWFYPCLAFMAVTGARRHSVLMLDVRDFDARCGIVTVRNEIAKQRRGHRYALPEPICSLLANVVRNREAAEPLFLSKNGRRLAEKVFDVKPYRKQSYVSPWRRVLDAAGIPARGVHSLRASVVTNLVEADCSLDLATEVTGQSADVARRHYLRTQVESQRRTMSVLARAIGLDDKRPAATGDTRSPSEFMPLQKKEALALLPLLDLLVKAGHNLGTILGTIQDCEGVSCSKSETRKKMVEVRGFEPLAYTLRTYRSPS